MLPKEFSLIKNPPELVAVLPCIGSTLLVVRISGTNNVTIPLLLLVLALLVGIQNFTHSSNASSQGSF